MSDPDDKIREVSTAIAERDHLQQVRGRLVQDVRSEEQRVQQLAQELRYEQADVERMTTGVMGFLNDLLAPPAVLAEEQRQVVEAQARLREAQGSVELLRQQVTQVDARIAELGAMNLDAELIAARAAKEQLLMRSGTSTAAELQDIAIRIESIDIELVPLVDAVNAGNTAFNALGEILAMLDAQRITSDKQAKALAGEAQAKIVIFQRALADVATASFADPPAVDLRDTKFVDDWIRALGAKQPPQQRLATARADMVARIERIGALLAQLRGRHDDLAARRAQLVADKLRLVG